MIVFFPPSICMIFDNFPVFGEHLFIPINLFPKKNAVDKICHLLYQNSVDSWKIIQACSSLVSKILDAYGQIILLF